MILRRSALKSSAIMIANGLLAPSIYSQSKSGLIDGQVDSADFDIRDPRIKEIASEAIDAALSAGAEYCDVRMMHTKSLAVYRSRVSLSELQSIGIRALYGGYWGMASGPLWNKDVAGKMGTAAFAQAKANRIDGIRTIKFRKATGAMTGHWEMPQDDDVFRMHVDEVSDATDSIHNFIKRLKHIGTTNRASEFEKKYKAFFSSDGHAQTQILNRTHARLRLGFKNSDTGDEGAFTVGMYRSRPGGLETLRDTPIREDIQKEYDEMIESWKLPIKPAEVGRFNTLIDHFGIAQIVSGTIGFATELDRALTFEANRYGTSYITDPGSMVGNLILGSTKLNVYANRTDPIGMATTAWDDEGVEPRDVHLVKDGVLNTMQTTRELIDFDGDMDETLYGPPCGYAVSADGLAAPINFTPNLSIVGDQDSPSSSDELRTDLGDGMELRHPSISLDHQLATGLIEGTAYEIKNGKRTSRLVNAGVLFRTSELWKSLIDVGGQATSFTVPLSQEKGEPETTSHHSVNSVPATFRELTFIDTARKA